MKGRAKHFKEAQSLLSSLAKQARGKNQKAALNLQIKDLKTAAKFKGKKADIYDTVKKVLGENPEIAPHGVQPSKIANDLYKKLGRKKATADNIFNSITDKYHYKDLDAIDTAFIQNVQQILWYNFHSAMFFLDGGLSTSDYKEAKKGAKSGGLDSFKHPIKAGSKIRSKKITLTKDDRVVIKSNNKHLETVLEIKDKGGIQAYYSEMKQYLVGQSSPMSVFYYDGVTKDSKGLIISYYLEDTGLEGEKDREDETSETETSQTTPISVPESETDKKLKLVEKELELEKAKKATIEAEQNSRNMIMRQIQQLKDDGFDNKTILHILKIKK